MVNKSYNEKCTTCCNIHCLNATVVFTVNKWSCFEHWNTYCVLVKWNPLNPLTLSVNVNMHVSASHSKTCALSRASPTVQSKTNIRHNNILRMENKVKQNYFCCLYSSACMYLLPTTLLSTSTLYGYVIKLSKSRSYIACNSVMFSIATYKI